MTDPAAGATLAATPHATQHKNHNDQILALETKVGINSSAVTTTLDFLSLARNVNAQTDNYTLVLADAGKVIHMNKGTAVNLTVPANATVAYLVGTVVQVTGIGAGLVTIVATGGVTISAESLVFRAQYSTAWLIKTATNTWVLVGDTVPTPPVFTQTYSTGNLTVANPTAATLTDNSAGTADTTLEALVSGAVYATDAAAIRNNFADLAAMVNKLTADALDQKKNTTSIIDGVQALKLFA
jgi:hypothetical protein